MKSVVRDKSKSSHNSTFKHSQSSVSIRMNAKAWNRIWPGAFSTLITFAILAGWATDAAAYDRWKNPNTDTGNCSTCHGDFTDGTSPKGNVFPSDSKHEMHRAASNMDAECNLCHTNGDGRNPFIGSSQGTANNAGVGCVGCHGRNEDMGNDGLSPGRGAGLRQHHTNAGVNDCSGCHSDANPANYTPVGEDVFPQYYGTADTNANQPCNLVATSGLNENWTIGDFEGADNDGDLLYDSNDPDCVSNQAPTSDPNGPYTGTVGSPVSFDGTASSDPEGGVLTYDWDFGDGGTGVGATPSYTYSTAGVFTVSLTVTDDGGLTDTATTSADISPLPNEPPVADPNGPYTGTAGSPVTFDGSGSSDPAGTIVSYGWDFGDGTSGSGVNPAHTYAAAGSYTVTLTVTDDDGASASASTSATISGTNVDLDIAQFRVTKRARLATRKSITITLVVRNGGEVNSATRPATVIGMQGGVEVYRSTVEVSDPVGDGRSRFKFPEYVPTTAGNIMWTATIADDDPDIDEASAVTVVR